ncbi:MAG: indolepyruvate ferredoxin oxidoreductase subunit alpha [Thermodesulfovibrionales bacterium]
MVVVNAEKCEGCEECVNICPQEVFEMGDGKSVPVNTAECVFCESCLGVCPTSVITITEM